MTPISTSNLRLGSKLNGSGAAAKLTTVLGGEPKAKPRVVKVIKQTASKGGGQLSKTANRLKKSSGSGLSSPSRSSYDGPDEEFDDEDLGRVASKAITTARSKPAIKIDVDDDDSLDALVEKPPATRPGRKAGRAAATKPVNYNMSSDSDDDAFDVDADLDDVSMLVKGVPQAGTASSSKALFAQSSAASRMGNSDLPATKRQKSDSVEPMPAPRATKQTTLKASLTNRSLSSSNPAAKPAKTLSPMAKAYEKKRAERQGIAAEAEECIRLRRRHPVRLADSS